MIRVLHHTPLSPACRKIRVQLKEKELDFTLAEEKPWERRDALIAMNPACEVPILREEKKPPIAEGFAISEYLEEAYPERNLIGDSPLERAEVRRLECWFDLKFNHEVTRNLLYEKYFKRQTGNGEPYSDAIRAGKMNILYHLDYIGHLTRHRNWLAGDRLSLADLSAAAHLSALDYFGDVPWEHNKDAKEWYALIKSRPSFREILQDHIPGFRPPAHYDDLDF